MEIRMLHARSLGVRAGEILSRSPITGQVLASFTRVCDLLTDRGEVLALAWDGVPNAPLNILLANRPGAALPAGTRFVVSGTLLQFLDKSDPILAVDLAGARSWDPDLDWRGLAAGRKHILARSAVVATLLAAEAPAGSLACLVARPATDPIFGNTPVAGPTPALKGLAERTKPDKSGSITGVQPARASFSQPGALAPGVTTDLAHLLLADSAIAALQAAYAHDDLPALRVSVTRLCGLGPGLTPSGDDWLAGWLIGLRLQADEERAQRIGRLVLEAAQERTTVLSQSFLACAAAGEVDEAWQGLLSALAAGGDDNIIHSTRTIMAHGETSGADMLTGFMSGLKAPGDLP